MVRRFKDFIIESNGDTPELHYMALDWDDNILHMSTKILMDKNVDGEWIPEAVSTAEFAKVRGDKENWRLRNDNPTEAFSEFRDFGPRGDQAFITDVKDAIGKGDFGPSWDAFIKCLTEGWIFSIITARGHEPESMRNAVEWIIDNVLTKDQQYLLYNNCLKHAYIFDSSEQYDRIPKGGTISQTPLIRDYLSSCDFYGVSSNTFAKEFGAASASNPEKAKELALDAFIEKCKKYGEKTGFPVAVGFSDDDPKNVEHVYTYFKEKSALSNDLKLNLYKTTDRTKKGGERTRFKGTEQPEAFESNQSINFDGLQSSVMPFTKWNNMTQNLYPSSKDQPKDDYHNQFKNRVDQANDLNKKFTTEEKSDTWIKDAIKKPGALRKSLKKGKDEKISDEEISDELSKLKKKDKDKEKPGLQLSKSDRKKQKRLTLAKTLKGLK